MPRWFLLSVVGIATRELASRQVREYVVPATLTSEAQPKAKALSIALRSNLDRRVRKILQAGRLGELNSLEAMREAPEDAGRPLPAATGPPVAEQVKNVPNSTKQC